MWMSKRKYQSQIKTTVILCFKEYGLLELIKVHGVTSHRRENPKSRLLRAVRDGFNSEHVSVMF
jgi:hypothetical protein